MSKVMLEKPEAHISYPGPVALISCADVSGQKNIITLAWVGTISTEPPLLFIGVRRGRHSYGFIKASGEFVVNVPTEDMAWAVDLCGTVSGRNVDKWQRAGLTPLPASRVKAPLIAQCPINLECLVKDILSPGSHDVFLGEVVATHVDERLLQEDGKVDSARVRPLVYFMREYWGLTAEKVAKRGVGLKP